MITLTGFLKRVDKHLAFLPTWDGTVDTNWYDCNLSKKKLP